MNCPFCGTELPNDAVFCRECGKNVAAGNQYSAPIQAPRAAFVPVSTPAAPKSKKELVSKTQFLRSADPKIRTVGLLIVISMLVSLLLMLSIKDKNGKDVNIDDAALTVSTRTIEVEIPIKMLKTVDLEAVIDYGDSTSEADVQVKVEPSEIEIAADASVLENIQKVQLPKIHMSQITSNDANVTLKIPMPDGCENMSNILEAQVTIKINNKSKKDMVIPSTNFTVIGVPLDMQVNYSTRALPITIRANSSDIDKISLDDIRVVVDLRQDPVTEGNNRIVPARIIIDGFEGAGAITDLENGYTVTLTLVPVK